MNWANVTLRTIGAFCLAGGLVAAQAATTARPGTINYVEGTVTISGQVLNAKSIGSTEVAPGQILRTMNGKAEMLLTPGVFLRLGDQSAVKMVSPSLTDTRVEVLQGEAMIEADHLLDGNHLVIADRGVDTHITKHGLYRFDANPAQLSVFDGKAEVYLDEHVVDVKKGKQLSLAPTTTARAYKPQKFDRDQHDALYQWSNVRSEYLARANESTVETFIAGNPGFYGMGWYWNPWYSSWAFVPGSGFYGSPFGYSFYSPVYWQTYAPYGYYGYPRYYYGGPRVRVAPGVRTAPVGGDFRTLPQHNGGGSFGGASRGFGGRGRGR